MSRPNVAKSRADKGGKAVSAPTPAQVHEIVPGKFTEQDWNLMVEHDENDDYISDIIEEISNSALDIIYKSYINRQLIPFTVCQAKDAIVQIIEWQFLSRDEGENNVAEDTGWAEDEEPTPAVTDCWAQGAVPRTLYTPREPIVEEDTQLEDIAEQAEREMSQIVEETQEQVDDSMRPPFGIEHERTIIQENPPLVMEGTAVEMHPSPQPPPEPKQTPKKKKKRIYKRHFGPLKSAGVGKLTQSLQESEYVMFEQVYDNEEEAPCTPSPSMMNMPNSCHSIVKLQAGRPPGRRNVVYDDHGNVLSLTKIHPEQLPNHKIPTRYTVMTEDNTKGTRVQTRSLIVDPEVEAAQARLEAMRTGRYIAGASKGKLTKPPKEQRPPASSKTAQTRSKARTSGTTFSVRTGASMRTDKTNKSTVLDGPRSPIPPPLIESMEVSPGVIVREGDRVKKGPKQRPKQEDLIASAISRGLRPITLNRAQAALSVAQILESSTPVVKPIVDHNPIPPIINSQSVQ